MHNSKPAVAAFWFRRDLRLQDNAALYHALRSGLAVLPVFIFDQNILDKLDDRHDARLTFIYKALENLNKELAGYGSSLLVIHNTPQAAWQQIIADYEVKAVYTNHDYEPYATERDAGLGKMFMQKNIGFHTFKDQLIFEKNEIVKENGTPYTVFTPYKRKWLEKLNPAVHLQHMPSENYAQNFLKAGYSLMPLSRIGFEVNGMKFPDTEYRSIIKNYKQTRDFPALTGTSGIGVHLRFGTLSIRRLVQDAYAADEHTWLNELIWREFYAMILWHFPHTVNKAFKPAYDQINWRNDEAAFKAWCQGKTGYPLVDAGMRQLNQTGWMHNRVRMITASFLSKHLLIDWRWGEAYFGKKLIDYELASNVGGWQWAAGCGNDAAPYFRVFNPALQTKRFDPKLEYIKKWVPEYADPFSYPQPVIEHKTARERMLKEFKRALLQPA